MSGLQLRPMMEDDLLEITAIEQRIHHFPWTLGNFSDALNSGYLCRVAELDGAMVGYAVMMPGVGEAELLDIGIVAERQGKGLGGELLLRMFELARGLDAQRMLLEVRPSNQAALSLYRKHGFTEIGRRRDYYAAGERREDAIVMERIL